MQDIAFFVEYNRTIDTDDKIKCNVVVLQLKVKHIDIPASGNAEFVAGFAPLLNGFNVGLRNNTTL